MSTIGKVYLVGAGCGNFDLITLRGMQLLQKCDAVVYDSLIDIRLLDFVPENAERICVGKRAGRHSETQENINKILVQKAFEGKCVVRLKGGDPFVFGRGGEEILALQEMKIPYSIVPGITSSVAAPEFAGIPVTHRKLSRGFHVITGHTADELLPENLQKYAQLDGTIVFLMGLKNLRKIAQELILGGMRNDIPAAVISCGGTVRQRVVRDRLDRIADATERESIAAPAVIVVGKTAGLDYSPTIIPPLDGVTVTVTGTQCFVKKLTSQLTELGADVNRLDFLRIMEYEENTLLDHALRNIEKYRWLVLTSTNGAEIFLKRLHSLKVDFCKLSALKLAVIGSGTAERLEKNGIIPELIPEKYTSLDLGKALVKSVKASEKVLILRAEKGSPYLTEILDKNKVSYDDIKTYDVVNALERKELSEIETDYLTFASASGVDAFFVNGFTISKDTKIICIGKITAEVLKKYGIRNFRIATVHNVEGIVDTILQEEKNEQIQKTAIK